MIGKTSKTYHHQACQEYWSRIRRYCTHHTLNILKEVPNSSKLDQRTLKIKEGVLYLKHIDKSDYVILLDEYGKQLDSVDFAKKIESVKDNFSSKTLHFIIGGAYGLDDAVKKRADFVLSLSKMTFSHQNIRPILLEQIYRAFTIINNEKYHNP